LAKLPSVFRPDRVVEGRVRPHHVDCVLFSEREIACRVSELAAAIAADNPRRPVALVGILRGSFVFLADLVRALHPYDLGIRVDFMILESYGAETESSGEVRLLRDFDLDVRDADVLLVDDILDTGRTLAFAKRHVEARGPRRVRTCVLLDKPARRAVPFRADYVAFECPDEFVVGYGLDYNRLYRDLPWIACVTFTEAASQ